MPLRYILKQFFLPPGFLLLLILCSWWLRRRFPKVAATCLVFGLGGLWAMSLPVVVEQAARWLETEPPLAPPQWASLGQQAEVVVIIGAGRERGDPAWGGVDQPTGIALERVRYAARLAKASGLPLMTSGGLHYGSPPSEAWIMAQSLQEDFNLPTRWLEESSRTTWENAVLSAQMLKAQGVTRIVLVTQAWHMQRARWCFEQAGLQVVPAPVGFLGVDNARPAGGWLPEMPALWRSGQLLNEAVGLVGYKLFYR